VDFFAVLRLMEQGEQMSISSSTIRRFWELAGPPPSDSRHWETPWTRNDRIFLGYLAGRTYASLAQEHALSRERCAQLVHKGHFELVETRQPIRLQWQAFVCLEQMQSPAEPHSKA